MTEPMFRALLGRLTLVCLSALTLVACVGVDEANQPEHIDVPATQQLHFEPTDVDRCVAASEVLAEAYGLREAWTESDARTDCELLEK